MADRDNQFVWRSRGGFGQGELVYKSEKLPSGPQWVSPNDFTVVEETIEGALPQSLVMCLRIAREFATDDELSEEEYRALGMIRNLGIDEALREAHGDRANDLVEGYVKAAALVFKRSFERRKESWDVAEQAMWDYLRSLLEVEFN
jgi:hypothetical protein